MLQHNDNIAALIGSRICHDLISPIGAVTNGLELMALSGAPPGPEMDLVTGSAASANARVRLFRLAFGVASQDQTVSSGDISALLADVYADSRIFLTWQAVEDVPRPVAQALMLALFCVEGAIAFGGEIAVSTEDGIWTIVARGKRVNADPDLWSRLTGPPPDSDIAPADVQFLLLPDLLGRLGRSCSYILSDTGVSLEF